MTLAEEFKSKNEYSDYPTHDEIAHELGAKQVHYDLVDTTRWGHVVEYVYERDGEYVKVTYTEGSGDSEYEYEPEIQEVFRVTKTVVDYMPAAKPLNT